MADQPDLTVYYDAACPVCRREIGVYRRLDRAGIIAWRDVHDAADDLAAHGVSPAQALARIRARGADGAMVSGAAVFVAIWRRIPGLRWLAAVAGTRPVLALLERGYVAFARRRRRRRDACDAGTCARP